MNEVNQKFRLAVHTWIEKDNKFLIVRRSLSDSFMPGVWDTPGGSLNFGEDPKDALIRETKEESNLKIEIGQLLFCHNLVCNNSDHWFALVYQCQIIGQEKIILDPTEHEEYRWVTYEELKQLPKVAFLEDFYINYLTKHV